MTNEEIEVLDAQISCAKLSYKTAKDGVTMAADRYDNLLKTKKTGLMTGWKNFDMLTGGFKKSNYIVLTGESGLGKTTFSINLARNVLKNGEGVVLFALEMDVDEVMDLIICGESRVFRSKFNTAGFNQFDIANISRASTHVSSWPLFIFDNSSMTMEEIRNACMLLRTQENIGLVIIDYLQLVSLDGYKDNREQQVAQMSRKCKALAKEMKTPVVALAQTNEKGEVRESKAIRHDANVVIDLKGAAPEITATINKGRSIPKGDYYFKFEEEFGTFTETGCCEKLQRALANLVRK